MPRSSNVAREGFAENKTVFGKILRGELPADVLYEDDQVLVFRDIKPVSEHHALIIPKRLIDHAGWCTSEDVPLLRHMETIALQTLQAAYPSVDVQKAHAAGTVSLGFHKFPLITVHHLHLHCIYPMPVRWTMPMARLLAFPQDFGWFYHSSQSVIEEAAMRPSPNNL